MADTDTPAQPMTDADAAPPPASTEFEPALPLKDAGVDFEPAAGGKPDAEAKPAPKPGTAGASEAPTAGIRQQLTSGADRLQSQAGEGLRGLADTGKQRAAGALDQLAKMLTDAAEQVDSKLGQQYGGYARTAADTVSGFSKQVQEQDLDELLDQGRDLVRKSPAVAIGAAAAVGFVLARLVQSGVDADRA